MSPWFLVPHPPSPVERCNLAHDEASNVDAALQLRFMLGIPASFWPPGSTFFSVTQAANKGINTNVQQLIRTLVCAFFWGNQIAICRALHAWCEFCVCGEDGCGGHSALIPGFLKDL